MPRLRVSEVPAETTGGGLDIVRRLCLGVSVSCFLWSGNLWLERYVHQAMAQRQFSDLLDDRAAAGDEGPLGQRRPAARLRIARLGVSGFVEEGFDAKTLETSIGMFPYGAKPGEAGNVILAARRDTFFAGLRDAREGDVIVLETGSGRRYKYRVARTFVVAPTASWMMHSTPGRRMLTLITCYPFRYIGNAPQRFVVQAEPADERGGRDRNKTVI